MILADAVTDVRRKARTTKSAASDTDIMNKINDALKEWARSIRSITKEAYITITPRFDIETFMAIRLTIVGGANEIVATDIVITAADAVDQTGTQVATALQTAIQAAITAVGGTPSLTVSWSTTEWKFTIDGIDCTSITIDDPSGITYSSALSLLGLTAETTTGTSVEGDLPADCTVESALPDDFIALQMYPEWNGDQLVPGTFRMFESPAVSGTPSHYYIRNKAIRLYPYPTRQGKLHIFYRYVPTTFTTVAGYQECGLSGLRDETATGLSASTQYYFKVNIDGGGLTEYDITTGTSVNYEEVIDLMNAEISGAEFALVNGDLRCTSDLLGAASSIALGAGTSGTDLFATLTGFTAFETAVDTEGGDDLDVDDEYAIAIVYMAASLIAEENSETTLADRYYAQFKRIVNEFIVNRASHNTSMKPHAQPPVLPRVET